MLNVDLAKDLIVTFISIDASSWASGVIFGDPPSCVSSIGGVDPGVAERPSFRKDLLLHSPVKDSTEASIQGGKRVVARACSVGATTLERPRGGFLRGASFES